MKYSEVPRNHPRKVLVGLMLAENFGDVHDEINLLHDFMGIPRPNGNFPEGWTDQDWSNLGVDPKG